MDRREFLAVTGLGGAALSAGCLGSDGPVETGRVALGSSTEDLEALDNGELVEVDGGTMRVRATAVQRSIFSPLRDNRVYEPAGGQFLLVQVDSNGTQISRPGGQLELETDVPIDHSEIPQIVHLTDRRDEVALGVPIASIGTALVRYPFDEQPSWTVPESLLEQFAAAPDFFLESADIRDREGETVLDLTVENRGDRDGTFRCTTAPLDEGTPETVRFTVNTGERIEVTVTNAAVASWPADATFAHPVDSETRAFVVE